MSTCEVLREIEEHACAARKRYGGFASTHEAMGVALEEWDELRAAVHANAIESVRDECIDLAAVLVRLARSIRDSRALVERSVPNPIGRAGPPTGQEEEDAG